MAFFEQIGKRLADAGQGVAQQTKNFADVTRLNSEISEKERKITQLYQTIGQTYYQNHSQAPEPEYRQAVEEIRALLTEIAQHQEEIKQIKGIVKCPGCGADVPLQAVFCNACGARMASRSPAPGDGVPCPACGALSPRGNRYCTHCGVKLIENDTEEE